jgi:phosphinothricin acetyltransferase
MELSLHPLTKKHWGAVSDIYLKGIRTGNATFESDVPSWDSWAHNHMEEARIIAILDKEIVGWAALSAVSSRCIYAGVAEVSVYVHPDFSGKGYGAFLLNSLIQESEKAGVWMLNASVFPENVASIALHKKCGFREIGYKEGVGKMSFGPYEGKWRNNVLLERRSEIVGV